MTEFDLISFGKYRGRPEEEMLLDSEYCQWLSNEPGIRALLARAVANTASPSSSSTPIGVDQALEALASHGIEFRRVPNYGGHDVQLISGKAQMLAALHAREQR